MEKKRLYKTDEGKIICGVCAGLAEYLDVDPTVVRLLWAALICCGGTGILLYIVCAIIFPNKRDILN